jgi:aspartate carbamoyltransferase
MPPSYTQRMKDNGFRVRSFASLDEYLAQAKIAPIWYFTRLQLERMGEKVLDKARLLREALTFRRDMMDKLPEGTRFYHPLPRDRVNATLPTWLDGTALNGWDGQSINGYWTRVVELGMLGGVIGKDFEGQSSLPPNIRTTSSQKSRGQQAAAHRQDRDQAGGERHRHRSHRAGKDIGHIWDRIDKVRKILKLNIRSSHGVYHSNSGPSRESSPCQT